MKQPPHLAAQGAEQGKGGDDNQHHKRHQSPDESLQTVYHGGKFRYNLRDDGAFR